MVTVIGFANAPITKGIIIATTLASLIAGVFHLTPYTHLQITPHLTVHHQYWRLIAHHFAFSNSSQHFLSVLLLYGAGREVERTFGSYKFAAFLLSVTALYTVLLVPVLYILDSRTSGEPVAPLFAILYQHTRIIPDRWLILIPPFQLSDRLIRLYILALLLFLSHPLSASLAIFSFLYRSDFILSTRLKGWRIPLKVYSLFAGVGEKAIGSTRMPTRSWRAEPLVRTREERRTEAQRNPSEAALIGEILRSVRRDAAPRGIRDFFTQIGPTPIAETDIEALQTMFPHLAR